MTQDETQHTLGQFDEIEDLIEEAKELEHLKEINQELLEALKSMLAVYDILPVDRVRLVNVKARTAIAKARGQQ